MHLVFALSAHPSFGQNFPSIGDTLVNKLPLVEEKHTWTDDDFRLRKLRCQQVHTINLEELRFWRDAVSLKYKLE